jgi:hypothetical protein
MCRRACSAAAGDGVGGRQRHRVVAPRGAEHDRNVGPPQHGRAIRACERSRGGVRASAVRRARLGRVHGPNRRAVPGPGIDAAARIASSMMVARRVPMRKLWHSASSGCGGVYAAGPGLLAESLRGKPWRNSRGAVGKRAPARRHTAVSGRGPGGAVLRSGTAGHRERRRVRRGRGAARATNPVTTRPDAGRDGRRTWGARRAPCWAAAQAACRKTACVRPPCAAARGCIGLARACQPQRRAGRRLSRARRRRRFCSARRAGSSCCIPS